MAKKHIIITLQKSELLYDIDNRTWLAGNAVSLKDAAKGSEMQTSEETAHRSHALRSLATAWKRLKSKLSEWVEEDKTTANNVLESNTGTLQITLAMPTNFAESATEDLASSLHDYLINASLAEWYITLSEPDLAKPYSALAVIAMTSAIASTYRRRRPAKRGEPSGGDEVLPDFLWHNETVWRGSDVWRQS